MQKPIPSRLSPSLLPPVRSHSIENAREPENRFIAGATGVQLANAWWLAELSLLAYREPDEIRTELVRNTSLQLVRSLNGAVAQGFVAQGDDFAVAAFRGTELFLPLRDRLAVFSSALSDVLANAQFSLVPAPAPVQGRLHQGFRDALNDDVFGSLQEGLAETRRAKPGCKIWLTGHSLGGALAILAAARLLAGRLQEIQGVYVYGAPRVGDADFGAGLRDLALRPVRFIHGSDIVTRVPIDGLLVPPGPGGLKGRFVPDGEAVSFDRQGRLRRGGVMRAMSTGIGGLLARAERFFDRIPKGDLIDHAPIFYAIHLWNLFDQVRVA